MEPTINPRFVTAFPPKREGVNKNYALFISPPASYVEERYPPAEGVVKNINQKLPKKSSQVYPL